MSIETKANINLAITVVLTGVYIAVLSSIACDLLHGSDFKARVAYSIPLTTIILALSAFLGGLTYDKLEKKYNYENWKAYNEE